MSRLTSQRRTILSTLFLIVTILAWTIGAWGQAAGQPVTNATVIRMVTDKLPEATIITRIQSGPDRFDLSPDGLVALSKAGVSKNILRAMMASNNQPAQSSTPSTPGGSGAISGAGNNPTPRNTATGTKRIPNVSAVKLTLGPKIKIAGGTQPSVSPTVSQTLQQQSLQTRAEKTATPVGGAGGTNPTGGSGMLMSAGTPAGGTSPGTNPTGAGGNSSAARGSCAGASHSARRSRTTEDSWAENSHAGQRMQSNRVTDYYFCEWQDQRHCLHAGSWQQFSSSQ